MHKTNSLVDDPYGVGGEGVVIKGRISVKDRNSTATAAAAAEEPKGINIYTKIQAYPTDSITGYYYLTKLLLRWANVNSSVCQILETPAEGLKVPRGRLMRFTAGEVKLDLKLGEEIKQRPTMFSLPVRVNAGEEDVSFKM